MNLQDRIQHLYKQIKELQTIIEYHIACGRAKAKKTEMKTLRCDTNLGQQGQ